MAGSPQMYVVAEGGGVGLVAGGGLGDDARAPSAYARRVEALDAGYGVEAAIRCDDTSNPQPYHDRKMDEVASVEPPVGVCQLHSVFDVDRVHRFNALAHEVREARKDWFSLCRPHAQRHIAMEQLLQDLRVR